MFTAFHVYEVKVHHMSYSSSCSLKALCLQNQSFTLLYYPANPANVAPQARPQPQRQMLTPAASYLYHTVLCNTLFGRDF